MGNLTPSVLPVALRAYVMRRNAKKPKPYHPRVFPWPEAVLILDAETTVDPSQRLTFGSYRRGLFSVHGEFRCLEEGLIFDDDLSERDPAGWRTLQAYGEAHAPATRNRLRSTLELLSRREFVERRLWRAFQAGALIVGYNLIFDLTRLGIGCGEPRHRMFEGGFSMALFEWNDDGTWSENRHRPRVRFKALDSKRTLMGLTGRVGAPLAERQQHPEAIGRFLDLRHLVFALTDRKLGLEAAARAFGLSEGKQQVTEHGRITHDYIDYNRQDVALTGALLEAVRGEWDRHPLALSPDKVLSPAGLAKGYLRAMNLTPPRVKFDEVLPDILGLCMTAYFGGRTEVRVRRTPVPVVYLDFLSMYPTVNSLIGLWRMLTAERLKVQSATKLIRRLLSTVTLEQCFDPRFWEGLCFFAKIQPAGDILPVRAAYGVTPDNTTIGVNPLWSTTPVWVAGPDLVASCLLTGKVPDVLEAFLLRPVGRQEGLGPVKLRGQIEIDPTKDDFFLRVIEERQRARRRLDITEEERLRLERFLKVVANSGSYGIYAEFNPQPVAGDTREKVDVYGIDGRFTSTTRAPEEAGEFCFPPFAALTTSAARLMLALLERCVGDLGGVIAFGDTDSAAVVAKRRGGLVPCAGGAQRLRDGREALRALSWKDVDALAERFRSLSPYDPEVVPQSILKVETINYDPKTHRQRQIYAFAISAKRYALFRKRCQGGVEVVDAKQHGLGHLSNPTDVESDDRAWIDHIWTALIREGLGEPLRLPRWVDRPALARVTVSTASIWRTFRQLNASQSYADSVKPMNFGLSPTVAAFGHPAGADPEHFHLLGMYEKNPRKWLEMEWLDKYSGKSYHIGIGPDTPGDMVRVKSYRDVFLGYRVHPEPKSLDPSGHPCDRESIGLLRRRPVRLGGLTYIGKESNALEQVLLGLVHSRRAIQPTYQPPQQSMWDLLVRPILQRIPLQRLVAATGLSSRAIRYHWNGKRHPSPAVEDRLTREAIREAKRILKRVTASSEDREAAEALLGACSQLRRRP